MPEAIGPQCWFVSPVYEDVESFVLLRQRLLEVVARDGRLRAADVQFVVIDDTAGLDPDIERLRDLPDVTVIEPPFNLGHQRAIVYALRTIAPELDDEDIVVTLDSDGEDRPEDLPRLISALPQGGGSLRSVALALRTHRRESLPFKILYFFFRLGFRALTGVFVRTGNYAAYRGWLARRILRHPYFDLSYSATLVSLKLPTELVPCARGTRYAGRSRMTYRSLVMHGLGMLMPFTDQIAVRALMAFSVTLGVTTVLAVAVVAVKLATSEAIPGWATYTLLLLAILSFIALGNFVLLFTVFSQSRGSALANLEQTHDRAAIASSETDHRL
jgi:hypothetical protein